MSEYTDKLKSIGTPRRIGQSKVTKERTPSGEVVQTEHWDGRQDATVRPDTVRFGARTHHTGKRKGEVVEITREPHEQNR